MPKKSKLRLPVEQVENGSYYFIANHDDELAKQRLDPTDCELVVVLGHNKWPNGQGFICRAHRLLKCGVDHHDIICDAEVTDVMLGSATQDFYLATKKEVKEAKERHKQWLHDNIELFLIVLDCQVDAF